MQVLTNMQRGITMTIKRIEDTDLLKKKQKAFSSFDSYCPYFSLKGKLVKCICQEFIDYPGEGYCPFGLYYKKKD